MSKQKNKTKMTKAKKVFLILLVLTVGLLSTGFITRKVVSNNNYIHNQKAEIAFKESLKDNFINNQKSTNVFKVGVKNSDFNGCGWISIYNANKILGIDVAIADIINELDVWGLNFYGLLGINPFAIQSFYKKRGFETEFVTTSKNFESKMKESKVGIFAYFSFEGGHYQTAVNTAEDKTLFYNPLSNSSVSQFLQKNPKTIKFMISIK